MPSVLRDPVFRKMKRRSPVEDEEDTGELSFI
jgi:hypothetical protein